MARGWESKSVESQMDSAAAAKTARQGSHIKTPEQAAREAKLDGLLLSRTRVTNDLQSTVNPRYREQLEAALAFLDGQIEALTAEAAE